MSHPEPRIRMLGGFNAGWIDFQDGGRRAIKGPTSAAAVVAALAGDPANTFALSWEPASDPRPIPAES